MTKITTEIISKLDPCKDRFDNFTVNYPDYDGDILDFLRLDKITARDKVWVSVRVLPRELVEIFTIDCAFSAAASAANANANAAAASAAYAAANAAAYDANASAAYAAYAAYASDSERERQIEALIWLIQDEGKLDDQRRI